MKSITDLKGKFKLMIPQNWHKEYDSTDFSSGIIASDTSKELINTIVLNVNWNNDTVFVNTHLECLIDSLNITVGLNTKLGKLGKINEYRSCFNFSTGFDTIAILKRNQYLYILKSDSIEGHILLTATVYGDTIKESQSELIAKIVESIKMNK